MRIVSFLLLVSCTGGGDDDRAGEDDGPDNSPGVDASQMMTADAMLANCAAAPIAPPAGLGLDPFYQKYLWAGLPVIGSDKVDDVAFEVACDIVSSMLSERPDIAAELRDNNIRVGIMDQTEVTTDMPEHSDLYTAFPGTDWDTRARGLAATLERPLTSCGEENLLALAGDPYVGESILTHEFGHTVWIVGVHLLPGGNLGNAELVAAYDAATAAGTFANTYAATDEQEYWAEGVQSWFDTNLEADPPDGIHNTIDTRAELTAVDPTLAGLIQEVFRDDDWKPRPY